MKFLLFMFALLMSATPLTAEERDWGAALRMDATALHDAIAENHPGPVNPADPGFEAHNDAQLARALDRAKTASSFADYFYALQEYTASFDDGHMGYGVFGNTPPVQRWPGFLTHYDWDGSQRVFAAESWSGVPVGAQVVSCDGLEANEVARKRIGSRFGRWRLASQRAILGGLTFLDLGDPYVGTIQQCRFANEGVSFDVTLQWRPPDDDLFDRYEVLPRGEIRATERRRLPDGTQWLALPSFDGNPDGDVGKSLRALVDYLDAHGDEVRAAPAIVLDLRGNGGGSADWPYQIASRLWGEGEIGRHPEAPMIVSWRASPGNLEYLREVYAERSKEGHLSPDVTAYFDDAIAGIAKAIEAHENLWVIHPTPIDPTDKTDAGPTYQLGGPVYILTDSFCMSACLDAVDLWTRVGAIPIGHETGADTFYLEVRNIELPAGLGSATIPMKAFSGRPRGSNEPVPPRHRFTGDMSDTAALEQWIATLPERQKDRGAN